MSIMYLSESVSHTKIGHWIASIFDATAVLVGLIEQLEQALRAKDTSRYVELATKVCGNTREVAFEVDFAVTAVGSQLFDEPTLLAEIERAQAAIETSHQLLGKVAGKLNQEDRLAKYALSTGNRLERLKAITRDKSLIAVYVRLWSDAHNSTSRLDDYKLSLQMPHDGFCLTAAQWIAHRLGWVLSELKLESGPYYEALRQHQKFFSKQKEEFKLLSTRVEAIPIRGSESWFVDVIKKAIWFEQQIVGDFGSVIQDSPLDEVTSQNIADDIHSRICRFLDGFQSSIEEFCLGESNNESVSLEPIEFVETFSVSTGLGRALLIQEPDAPRKWSAVGLDFRCIGFGDTEEQALASLEANITIELQINPNQKNHRLNKQTLKRFEEAEAYTPSDGNDKFSVRRSQEG
jgi:hypothetical protein